MRNKITSLNIKQCKCNFHPFEVVGRHSGTQLQLGEKDKHANLCKLCVGGYLGFLLFFTSDLNIEKIVLYNDLLQARAKKLHF